MHVRARLAHHAQNPPQSYKKKMTFASFHEEKLQCNAFFYFIGIVFLFWVYMPDKMTSLSLERVGLFVVVLKGVEFPGPGSFVCLAVGSDVTSGFEFGCELNFGFGSAVMLSHLGVGISESSRVVFLLGRLILLVGFFAFAVELLAVAPIEVTGIFAVGFAADTVDC